MQPPPATFRASSSLQEASRHPLAVLPHLPPAPWLQATPVLPPVPTLPVLGVSHSPREGCSPAAPVSKGHACWAHSSTSLRVPAPFEDRITFYRMDPARCADLALIYPNTRPFPLWAIMDTSLNNCMVLWRCGRFRLSWVYTQECNG